MVGTGFDLTCTFEFTLQVNFIGEKSASLVNCNIFHSFVFVGTAFKQEDVLAVAA